MTVSGWKGIDEFLYAATGFSVGCLALSLADAAAVRILLFVSLGCLTLFLVLFVRPPQHSFQASSCDVAARGGVQSDVRTVFFAEGSLVMTSLPVSRYESNFCLHRPPVQVDAWSVRRFAESQQQVDCLTRLVVRSSVAKKLEIQLWTRSKRRRHDWLMDSVRSVQRGRVRCRPS